MSKVHYFQRYSSVENTVTNNTLHLFQRIYQHSSAQAFLFLYELTQIDFGNGLSVTQQTGGVNSVPDGSISQESFRILIETKVDSAVNVDQLFRHASGFTDEKRKLLLLLTREALPSTEEKRIQHLLAEQTPGVTFKSVTYVDVCAAASGLFAPHDIEMQALIGDFEAYCSDMGLLDDARHWLRVVPCGISYTLNLKHAMYFQPSSRGYSRHAFIGVYKDKSVRGLLEIDSVFDVTLNEQVLEKTLVDGRDTSDYDERIRLMIDEASRECGYN